MNVHKRRLHGDVLMRPREGGTMRRLLAIAGGLAVAAAYFTLSALPALSADNGAVNAQVTVATACITLDKNSLDFGSLSFSSTAGPILASAPVTITNCGAAATIFGRGTNAKNGAGSEAITWTLDENAGAVTHPCNLGVNRYMYLLGTVVLSTADKQLLGNSPLGSGSAATISNQLLMPCTGSGGSGLTMSWDIIYTATL